MEWSFYFLLYSVIGFGLEVAFARLTHSRKQDRKCMLFAPLCPVYGLGALGILLLPSWIQDNALLFFLGAGVAAAGAEYAMGWFYERCWGVRFWNYSHLPFQLHGRVCLPFALAWGLLGFPLRYWVHPIAQQLYRLMPMPWLAALSAAFWADFICTALVLGQSHDTNALRWWVTAPSAF